MQDIRAEDLYAIKHFLLKDSFYKQPSSVKTVTDPDSPSDVPDQESLSGTYFVLKFVFDRPMFIPATGGIHVWTKYPLLQPHIKFREIRWYNLICQEANWQLCVAWP